MLYPQEIEVWYILPVIRKELAKSLLEKGLTQKQIAQKMNITEAAVSQYIKEKRATLIKLNNKIKREIEKSSNRIIKKNSSIIKEIKSINNLIWKDKIICKIHQKYDKLMKNKCNLCFK